MEPEILTEAEAAELLGYKVSSMRKLRFKFPHYIARTGKRYYKRSELTAIILETRVDINR